MSNNIEELRRHLFETLTALKDKDNPMDIERAKAVSDVAQVIINTAKVEVEYAKATGATGSQFLEMAPVKAPPGALPHDQDIPKAGVRRYVDGRRVA